MVEANDFYMHILGYKGCMSTCYPYLVSLSRLVYALQTFSALLTTMYQRASQDCNINIKLILLDNDNYKMQKLLEHCSSILSGILPHFT